MESARLIFADLFGLDFGIGLGGGSAAGRLGLWVGGRGGLAVPFALFTTGVGGGGGIGLVLETVFGGGVEAKLAQPNVGVGGDAPVSLTEDAAPTSLA